MLNFRTYDESIMQKKLTLSVLVILFMQMTSFAAIANPSRFEVMKVLKWRVVNVLETNLQTGSLDSEQKEIIEYTLYKIKSSLGQFTDKSYFEELYQQTAHLVKIKEFINDRADKNKIDDLISLYQSLLKDLYKD